jgi:hypothetical protein
MVLVLIKVHEEAHLILAEPLHGQLDAAHPGVVGVPALLLQITSNCVRCMENKKIYREHEQKSRSNLGRRKI